MKIAIINARNIFPLNGGDKLFSYNLLKILARKHEILYINIVDEGIYPEMERKELEKAGNIILHVLPTSFITDALALVKSCFMGMTYLEARRAHTKQLKQEVKALLEPFQPEIIVWDQIRSAVYFTPQKQTRNFLIEHNNEIAIYRERGKHKSSLVKRFYDYQAGLLEKFTKKVHAQMAKIIYLNKENITQLAAPEKYTFFPKLFTRFDHADYTVKPGDTITLLFVGAMDWYPNVRGIQWFAEKVMPLLPSNVRLHIVGRNAKPALSKLINSNIQVYTDVESVESFYLDADLFISPVFEGSGINLKILEAASFGIPIIATPFSLRGFTLDFLDQPENEKEFVAAILAVIPVEKRKEISSHILSWYKQYMEEAATDVENLFVA